jgi:hypothetical protein
MATKRVDRHTPAVQLCSAAHALPQVPQFALFALRFASQPLAAIPSQSAYPIAQVSAHAPPRQVGDALAPAAQAIPHMPQCEAVVVMSVSQPLVVLPSQLPRPASQVIPQAPLEHVGVAFAALGQVIPHVPQFARSFVRLTHALPQRVVPALHPAMHVPPVQVSPVAHARPHMPQFAPLVMRSTQAPPQAVCPVGHTRRHVPVTQLCPVAQALPHMPQ